MTRDAHAYPVQQHLDLQAHTRCCSRVECEMGAGRGEAGRARSTSSSSNHVSGAEVESSLTASARGNKGLTGNCTTRGALLVERSKGHYFELRLGQAWASSVSSTRDCLRAARVLYSLQASVCALVQRSSVVLCTSTRLVSRMRSAPNTRADGQVRRGLLHRSKADLGRICSRQRQT